LLFVRALGQRNDAGSSPVPSPGLSPAHEMAGVVLGGGELPLRVAGVVVLAVNPVRVNSPVLVREFVGNLKIK
jgi:hypothetical protein